MRFNTFVGSVGDLERCRVCPNLKEVLLEPTLLARRGQLTVAEVRSLSEAAKKWGLRPVLVWDILMPERLMAEICDRISDWNIGQFAAIRVCDPGAAEWLTIHYPNLPIQLILETGNHNFEALMGWCELFAGSLERLILSTELPEHQLIEYCRKLPVPCEVLGVGRILLFYSPRSLLSSIVSEGENRQFIETTARTEESGNRPLPTLETPHGTFLFLDKDWFILDQLDGLKNAGLHTLRLDLRHLGNNGDVAVDVDRICRQISEDPVMLKKNWPVEARSPFFNANRTTSIFPRMKSKSKIARYRDEFCVAEALAGESGKYVVFQTLRPFHISEIDKIVIPTGQTVKIPETVVFKNLSGEGVERCDRDRILITDWIKKVTPGSLILRR
ncbi:MAG: U32 family peptidase [Limnospira sp.]